MFLILFGDLNSCISFLTPVKWTRYIEEDDLCCFLKKEEVELVFPLFEGGAETRKIRKKALKNWLVNSLSIHSIPLSYIHLYSPDTSVL